MCKDAFETQRQDFLFYCLFGITKTEADCEIDKHKLAFYACIDRAYRDLSRTVKYVETVSSLDEMKKRDPEKRKSFIKLKDDFKDKIKEIIVEYIFGGTEKIQVKNKISSEPEQFDDWHKELCDKIVNASKSDDFKMLFEKEDDSSSYLSYGQAQKWVNMTLKYMVIMGLLNFDEYKECLHVPIDRYILREILGGGEKYNGKAWSQINYEEYKEIRKKIDSEKGTQTAIEWESIVWLKQAKEENENKNK